MITSNKKFVTIMAKVDVKRAKLGAGINETERRRRKESNLFTTNINFIAWLLEVSELKHSPTSFFGDVNDKCFKSFQAGGIFALLVPLPMPQIARWIWMALYINF